MHASSSDWVTKTIQPGATLAIVASSGPADEELVRHGVEKLKSRYNVVWDETLFARKGYLAGDDAHRTQTFLRALESQAVDALLVVRGGYGAMRIVSDIPVELVRKAGKPLIGFSDVTTLHARWAQAKVASFHGPMLHNLMRIDEAAFSAWIEALEGRGPKSQVGLQTVHAGSAEGILFGGNLSLLTALLGTPYFPPLEDKILLIEDWNEAPYRVDRMLTSLRLAGVWQKVQGVVFGLFTNCPPAADGVTVEDVLEEHFRDLSIPVLRGLYTGHVDDGLMLPLGVRVKIDSQAGEFRYL